MKAHPLSRRTFVKYAAVACAPVACAWPLAAANRAALKPLRFGLCADPHKDLVPDADERLRVFIEASRRDNADFILQLGDFCQPLPKNRGFLEIWESFKGPRYHTLGNHDRDGGLGWQATQDYWGMPQRYYSFDHSGWHFVVLDGNEIKPVNPEPGYPHYIGAEQLGWLREDLHKTTAPTLVFSHQSLEADGGLENRAEVRGVLEQANTEAGWRKIGACLNGHHHIDFHREINGIQYVQVNSMSYVWLGNVYAHVRYSDLIDKAYPALKFTAPYKESLFARVQLDPETGLTIQGVSSEFVGPSPWDLGLKERPGTLDHNIIAPRISDRRLKISSAARA